MSDTDTTATSEWFVAMPGWSRARRLVLGCFGAGFLGLIACGPLLLWFARPARTASSVPPPEWRFEAFRRGEYADQLETYWKESSWLTFHLRGWFHETLLQLGVLASERVAFGRDGWMFLAETLRWHPERIAASRASRLQLLGEVRAFAAAAGMQLLALPVPDKATIYPEQLPAERRRPPGRERLYDQILADLQAAGVAHVDLRAVLLAEKARQPETLLYLRRGTHWQLEGQLAAAAAVQQRLQQAGWAALVPREPAIVVGEVRTRERVPGLVRQLGLRCESGETDGWFSPVVARWMEPTRWRQVGMRGGAPLVPVQPTAAVALCGTSFSQSLGPQLAGTLGAHVDQRGVIAGGGSFQGLRRLRQELGRDGFAPRVLLWEFVERDYQDEWTRTESLFE